MMLHMPAVSRRPDGAPSRLLAITGVLLLGVAAAGFLMGRSELLAGGFLIVGAALTLVSVLVPRLEGAQELTLTGAKIFIAKVQSAEAELETKRLPELEDLT
jgi:hypothetical protein